MVPNEKQEAVHLALVLAAPLRLESPVSIQAVMTMYYLPTTTQAQIQGHNSLILSK